MHELNGVGPTSHTIIISLILVLASTSPKSTPLPHPTKNLAPPPPTAADHDAFRTKDLLVISDSIVILKHDQVSSTATSFLSNPF